MKGPAWEVGLSWVGGAVLAATVWVLLSGFVAVALEVPRETWLTPWGLLVGGWLVLLALAGLACGALAGGMAAVVLWCGAGALWHVCVRSAWVRLVVGVLALVALFRLVEEPRGLLQTGLLVVVGLVCIGVAAAFVVADLHGEDDGRR